MTLVRTNASKPVPASFGGFFDDFLTKPLHKWLDDDMLKPDFRVSFPPVNIQETKDSFLLDVVAPGMEKGDFKIKTEGNTLIISAEKKEEKKEESDKQIRKEYSVRSFTRSFTLDDEIDGEKINAKYENGVLQLALPKKEEKIEKHQEIAVQ